MYNVLYVPKLACNLFSVRAGASKGNTVKLGHSKCWIRDRNGKLRGMGSLVDKINQLDCQSVSMECASNASEQRNEVDLWHQHLGPCEWTAAQADYPERAGNWCQVSKHNSDLFLRGVHGE